MKFNDVEAPSIRATVEDDGSWTSGNIDRPERSNSSSSSDEEEISRNKCSNTTESSEDIMFTRNIEESFIQFGSSLADVVCNATFSLNNEI